MYKKVFLPLFCLLFTSSIFSQSRFGLGFEGYYQPVGYLSYFGTDYFTFENSFAPSFNISYGYQIDRSSILFKANYDILDTQIDLEFRDENNQKTGTIESRIRRVFALDLLYNFRLFEGDMTFLEIGAGPSVVIPQKDYLVKSNLDGSTEKLELISSGKTPVGFAVLPMYSFVFNHRQIGGKKYGLTFGVPFKMYWVEESPLNPHYMVGVNVGLFLHLD